MSARLLGLGLVCLSLASAWRAGDAQAAFTIDEVRLTMLPGTAVETGSEVTLRCEVRVSHASLQPLTHAFSFHLGEQIIYSKNSSGTVVERILSPARMSNTGRYHCSVRIQDKVRRSVAQTLQVKGLQVPVLTVRTDVVSEGDEVVATCSAPDETGTLIYFFYETDQDIKTVTSSNNSVTTTLSILKLGDNYLQCAYKLMMLAFSDLSSRSNTVKVIVRDLEEITPQIQISPNERVVEGDRVAVKCAVRYPSDLELFLIKGSAILRKFHTSFTYSLTVQAQDSGDYVCKAEKGTVQKTATSRLNITELFSRPVLKVTPEQVFEGERFRLSCSTTIIATQKISAPQIQYVLLKENQHISAGQHHVETASAAANGKYYCTAASKGVNKTSAALLMKARVPISSPVIRAVGMVIVGQPFQLSCEAENGTLPITYTLLKIGSRVAEMTVTEASERTLFNVPFIKHPEEIHSYSCEAQNQGPSLSRTSSPLRAAVIVPVSEPVLSAEPVGLTVTEGSDLVLMCRVQQGSEPITFSWYHEGLLIPLSRREVRSSKGTHVVKAIERDQRGKYHCEATNHAAESRRSLQLTVRVSLALWKKALIGVFCILLFVVIVIVLTVLLKKMSLPHRRRRQATELTVKPSRPKSGDPMRMSLTLDIEDNTALNGTPCVMGRSVWSENVSGSDTDDQTDEASVMVQPHEVEVSRVPVTCLEPDYSPQHPEVQESGESEQTDGVEYAQLNTTDAESA